MHFTYEAKQKANMRHLCARRKSPALGSPPSPSSSPTPTPATGVRGGLAATDDDVEAGLRRRQSTARRARGALGQAGLMTARRAGAARSARRGQAGAWRGARWGGGRPTLGASVFAFAVGVHLFGCFVSSRI